MRMNLILCVSAIFTAVSGQSSNSPCLLTLPTMLLTPSTGGCPIGSTLEQNIQFYLSNRLFPDYNQIFLDETNNLNLDLYDSTKPTVFLVHGFSTTYDAAWLQYLKEQWLDNVDCNIIAVDWSCLAVEYNSASTLNIGIVGNQIGKMMIRLQNAGYSQIVTVTCYGHSLGAHVCGFAGKYTFAHKNLKLAVIYGSDPAGLCITEPLRNPDNFRLIATDATYVEVYHCTFGVIGVNLDCGVVDIYFNLGIIPQCGCSPLNVEIDSIEPCPLSCDHANCNLYFIFSLFINNRFTAKKLNVISLALYTTTIFADLHNCPSQSGISAFNALLSTSLVIGIHGNHQQTGRFYCPTTYNPPHCPRTNDPTVCTDPNYIRNDDTCDLGSY